MTIVTIIKPYYRDSAMKVIAGYIGDSFGNIFVNKGEINPDNTDDWKIYPSVHHAESALHTKGYYY